VFECRGFNQRMLTDFPKVFELLAHCSMSETLFVLIHHFAGNSTDSLR